MMMMMIVSRITQTTFDRFSQNSVERWHMGYGKKREISAVIRSTLR